MTAPVFTITPTEPTPAEDAEWLALLAAQAERRNAR